MSKGEASPSVPGWAGRGVALLEYLGAAPLLHVFRQTPRGAFAEGHHAHALALLLVLAGVALLYLVGILLVTAAIMISRSLYEDYHIEGHVLSLLRKMFLAWAVFWAFAIGTALLGREAYLPVVWRLARRARLLAFAAWLWLAIFAVGVSTAAFATHAATKVRDDAAPGTVYILYEDGHFFPRWLFHLGFYPIARAAEDRFGPGQAVMLRVTRESLRRGLSEATFIFLGTHGMREGILVPDGFFKVSDVEPAAVNPSLRYVYMSGCDQGAGWETAFAPAKVITFDRLTTVLEHIWWIWFDGPAIVRGLP